MSSLLQAAWWIDQSTPLNLASSDSCLTFAPMRTAHAMGPLGRSLVCRAGLLLEPNGRAAWAAPCHSTQFWQGWELCFSISRLMHSSSRTGAEQSTPEGDAAEGAARQKKQEAAVEDAIRDSLRRLYKMVHPDLFSDHATAKVRRVSAGWGRRSVCPFGMRGTVRETASSWGVKGVFRACWC